MLNSIHHRYARAAKRKNILQLSIPDIKNIYTRAIKTTKNKLKNRLGKRKSKRKQQLSQWEQEPHSTVRRRPKSKSPRGNVGKVRGIIQDILHKPRRQNGKRKKKPRRIHDHQVRHKRRNKNRKRNNHGQRGQQNNRYIYAN